MEKILVTGAGGMVGSHVVDLLRSQGRDVIGVGRPGGLREVDDYADLRDPVATHLLVSKHKPTAVIHTAACVFGIMGNMMNQGMSYYENNVINTNVVEAAHLTGVRKFTAMGTGAVYPVNQCEVYYTSDIFEGRPHKSEAGYAHAKRGMLAMLEAYQQSYGMDYAFIVSCNLFGPRDKFDPQFGHVVPSLVRKFHEAKRDDREVIVWGDGSAQRDFLYVKDAAKAVQLVNDGFLGPVNMGSGSVWRIKEVVRVLTKISGLHPDRVLWDSTKPNGQAHRAYDLSALTGLGFKPEYSIPEALQETWDWYGAHA